jgi:PAS domain S-box-containing protein
MEPRASILLVEDHGATRHTVTRVLTNAGFEVHEAKDGASALALMTRHRPQLVIQDLMLPDVDGFVLARKLRSLASDQSVCLIAFSGLVSNLDARRIAEMGFDDVIAKPVMPSRLVELVHAHLGAAAAAYGAASTVLRDVSDPRLLLQGAASNSQASEHDGEMMRRCSALSAELTVLRALSMAVLQQGDVEGALVGALSTCFDAGHSGVGALYLYEHYDQLRTRPLGSERHFDVCQLPGFFGHESWLRATMQAGAVVTLSSAHEELRAALAKAGVQQAILVPLMHLDRALGALFMVAPPGGQDSDLSFQRFACGIADQAAHALALAEAFRAREHAEREAEQQRRLARDQAAMWRAMVDAAPDVVMHLDARGTVRFMNRVPAAVTGGHALALSWFDLFEPDYHEEMRGALASVFSQGASHTLELCQRAAGDTLTWIESHLGPVRNGGEVTGALVIQRDVSEKRLAEAQLIVTDRMTSVSSLAAAIAHEVNNPLASLLINLELALRDTEELGSYAPGELLEELQDAREAATRVRGIVGDLKVFSQPHDDSFGPIHVERVVDSALRMAWNELRQRATVQREFQSTPRIYGNESQLGHALLSLLLHAVNRLAQGDAPHNTVLVQLYTDARGDVVICVTDSAPALSSSAPPRLLAPFTSARPAGASDSLGLSVCQRVLQEHGGRLSVESQGATGNVLRVTLPAYQEPRREHPLDGHSETRALRRGRVLVIDEERLVTQVVRRTLGREHEVTMLDNAADALRKLEAGERFDAIVCDLMMSGLSGMEFHARVARDFPDLAERIVFFTGDAFTPRAREFLQRVPNHRVEKPVAGHELRAVINTIVR